MATQAHDPNPTQTHALLGALAKAFASTTPPAGLTSYGINGTATAPAAIAAQLTTYFTAYDTVVQADVTRDTALNARSLVEGQALQYVDQVVACVRGVLGPKNPALDALAIKPEKDRKPLTTAQQQTKIAKAQATRVARHTLGKNQKKAIKGVVPPASTPAPAPATPAAATPAAATPATPAAK